MSRLRMLIKCLVIANHSFGDILIFGPHPEREEFDGCEFSAEVEYVVVIIVEATLSGSELMWK